MSSQNPFLYSDNPYRRNPFTVLSVPPEMTQANIEQFARAREQMLAAGQQPDPEMALEPGECDRAAQFLQEPVLRLAFDLMMQALVEDEDEP